MKPPLRKRAAPTRYEQQHPAVVRIGPLRLTWTSKEKIQLLRGLKAQRANKSPDPPVSGRSQGEVSSYISWLRGRAAREAVQTEYERWVLERKAHSTKPPAPIEVWTDLTSRMADSTEDALTTAFSQMLTIAATEPIGLLYSVPPQATLEGSPTKDSGGDGESDSPESNLLDKGSAREKSGSSGEETVAGQEPTISECDNNDLWKQLDFEKIYKYMSKAAKGGPLPKLSTEESAVLLHLLHSLPDQLQNLDCNSLGSYLCDKYASLNAHPDLEETDTSTDQPNGGWKDLGYCPLNPFLIPLELLRLKERD
ncbi:Hypothetical predicted protein [Pelobates cultripes]|uniref:snRNA-activating protein complex subunit 2 n=1 Tax=Pelobates cultripes TaxID=61616 RepID=A0AAD1RJB6_PELCU|nr:Hypothetical predicted protein [Pelobates cultripes]